MCSALKLPTATIILDVTSFCLFLKYFLLYVLIHETLLLTHAQFALFNNVSTVLCVVLLPSGIGHCNWFLLNFIFPLVQMLCVSWNVPFLHEQTLLPYPEQSIWTWIWICLKMNEFERKLIFSCELVFKKNCCTSIYFRAHFLP